MQKIGNQSTALTRAIECGGDCSKGAQGSSVCGEVAGERVACSSHAVPTVLISSATPGGNTGAEIAACSSKTNKAPRIIAKPPCVPREREREVYPVTPQRPHLPKLSSQPLRGLGTSTHPAQHQRPGVHMEASPKLQGSLSKKLLGRIGPNGLWANSSSSPNFPSQGSRTHTAARALAELRKKQHTKSPLGLHRPRATTTQSEINAWP